MCNCSGLDIPHITDGNYTDHTWHSVTYVCDDGYIMNGNATLFCEKSTSSQQWQVNLPSCVSATTPTGATTTTPTTTTTTPPPTTPPPGSTNTEQLSTTSRAWNELSLGASKSLSTTSDNPISTNASG
ncbi:integumentary mucin C.1-like [Mya arenaria]|uniref:integumentary mucin C.1-like n=1 Tax=Mya arenaria TaxID=6604 RepID=UPI0022E22CEF|nr:integumentary mucin C.1-like [Mya arenaria]